MLRHVAFIKVLKDLHFSIPRGVGEVISADLKAGVLEVEEDVREYLVRLGLAEDVAAPAKPAPVVSAPVVPEQETSK